MMKPLAGIRVLAIEQFGAGPYGSMYLAELGAEVIKIENRATGGDPSRVPSSSASCCSLSHFESIVGA